MDLKATQKVIYQNKIDKGFNIKDINKEFCLLYGEVSEAYEAWRKQESSIGEELADVAIYLLGLSDLEKEIESKIEVNKNRKYKSIDGVIKRI